jgi:hypothetical protein
MEALTAVGLDPTLVNPLGFESRTRLVLPGRNTGGSHTSAKSSREHRNGS